MLKGFSPSHWYCKNKILPSCYNTKIITCYICRCSNQSWHFMPLLIAHISFRLYYTYTLLLQQSKDRSQLSRENCILIPACAWVGWYFWFIGHTDIQTKACLLNAKLRTYSCVWKQKHYIYLVKVKANNKAQDAIIDSMGALNLNLRRFVTYLV